MKNFNARFSKIRSDIRRGRNEDAIIRMNELQADILVKLDSLHNIIETKNRECLPISDRYLEVLTVKNSSHRLTINPVTGRVTLKVSEKASDTVRQELIDFATDIMNFDKFKPVTYRGRIKFYNDKYIVQLENESKRFKENFEMESINE